MHRRQLLSVAASAAALINAALADARLKAQIAEFGGMILAGSPADFRKLIADETEKWGKVIRTSNIKPE